MSYQKAMKHWRNLRKCKKQGNMYFGFAVFAEKTPSVWSNPVMAARLNVGNWFRERNQGGAERHRYIRECIKEQIEVIRSANSGNH